jgi:hypothetical protein
VGGYLVRFVCLDLMTAWTLNYCLMPARDQEHQGGKLGVVPAAPQQIATAVGLLPTASLP